MKKLNCYINYIQLPAPKTIGKLLNYGLKMVFKFFKIRLPKIKTQYPVLIASNLFTLTLKYSHQN